MAEDSFAKAEFLLPAMAAFANRVLQVPPQPKADAVGVKDVATQGFRALHSQESRCYREVVVMSCGSTQQLQACASSQNPLQSVRIAFQVACQLVTGSWRCVEMVEHTQRHSGKDGF